MKSIFISSTFKDMQAERDILHQRVFPALRRRLAAYGEDVQELDLRWGVDTSQLSEEESGQFVIEACIDSIDRCKPYMIVLLGNRYGWIPDRKVVEDTGDGRILSWCGGETSITQMEILYGALSRDKLDKCVFCFRNETFPQEVPDDQRPIYAAESSRHAGKLSKLKEEIRAREDAVILEYTAVWDDKRRSAAGLGRFEERLTEALWAMIAHDLGGRTAPQSPAGLVLQNAELTKERYLATYVSRMPDREAGPSALIGRKAFWFVGEGGSGKSAVMSKIAAEGQAAGAHIFLYFGGSEGCSGVSTFLLALLTWLRTFMPEPSPEACGLGGQDGESVRIQLHDMLARKQPCDWAVLIDGVDQMDGDIVPVLRWLASRMIRGGKEYYWHGLAISSSTEFADRYGDALGEAFNRQNLPPLTNMELNTMIQNHAARRGKKLDAKVMRCLRAQPRARNPFHLSLLLQRLFMMDQHEFERAEALSPGMEGLSLYMCQEIRSMPEDTGEMTVLFLRSAAEKLAARMERMPPRQEALASPMEVLELLAASRDGLSLEELGQVLAEQGKTFPPVFMEHLFCYLYDSFGESEQGVWNFKHRLLRENLISHMGPTAFRHNCALLLRHCELAGGAPERRLYYAWQADDVPAGLRCLTPEEGRARETPPAPLWETFRTMLAQDSGDYLTALARGADAGQAGTLLSLLELAATADLPQFEKIRPLLAILSPNGDAPAARRALAGRIELAVLYWELDPRPYCAAWRKTVEAHRQLRPMDRGAWREVFGLCVQALRQERFSPLWQEALELTKTIRDICGQEGWGGAFSEFGEPDAACGWAELLVRLDSTPGGERGAHLLRMREYLEPLKGSSPEAAKWQSYLAHCLIRLGRYTDGVNLMNEALKRLKFPQEYSGSLEAARAYVEALAAKTPGVKNQYAVAYLREAREICRQKVRYFPATYWRHLLGQVCVSLYDAMEKSGDQDLLCGAPKVLDEAIQVFDALVEDVGAGQLPEKTMLGILSARYKRIMRRKSAQNPRKYTGCWEYPWQHLDEQRADFQYLEREYTALDARSDYYSAFSELCWTLLEKVRYIDQCHLPQEEFREAGDRLLECASAQAAVNLFSMQWNGAAALLDLAEILYRRQSFGAAETLTPKIRGLLDGMDRDQIIQRKRTLEFRRLAVRCYLMEARVILHNKGGAGGGTGYIRLAAGLLDGTGDGQEPLPARDDKLRSEMRILSAELLLMAGNEDGVPEILDGTDRFWPEETCNAVLLGGAREEKTALLRYCHGLSIRAWMRKDPTYMDRALPHLQALTDTALMDWDAGFWPELYRELLSALRFYWEQAAGQPLPQNLVRSILGAFVKLEEQGALDEREQRLFAAASLEATDSHRCPELGFELLLEPGWLRQVLARVKAQNWPAGQNYAAARLALALALRGDLSGALAAAGERNPEGNPDSLCLLDLTAELIAALRDEKAPPTALLPRALAWRETPQAKKEPFLRFHLGGLCALADSFGGGQAAEAGARHAVKRLQALIKSLGSGADKTVLRIWLFRLLERLLAAQPRDSALERRIELLRAGEETARGICGTLEDPAERETLMRRINDLGAALAEAYREAGNGAKCSVWLLGTIQSILYMEKELTQERLEFALRLYEQAVADRDREGGANGPRQLDWIWLMEWGGRLFQHYYEYTKDPAWMERQAAEAALYRKRLLETAQESLFWREEKAANAWRFDCQAWLTLLNDRPAERKWFSRYLDAVREQVAALTEGSERTMEELAGELYALEPVSEEEQAAIDRVIDQITVRRKRTQSDLMYLTFQAMRELGEGATGAQAAAYVEKRRAARETSSAR